MVLSDSELLFLVFLGIAVFGYGSAWIFAHYLDRTTNGHLLQYLKQQWRKWRK